MSNARAYRRISVKAQHRNVGGNLHQVEIDGLRVWVYPADGQWVAHGIDVDYAASGETMQKAQRAFIEGFMLTIVQHLLRFKSLEKLLSRGAPDDVRRRWIVAMESHQVYRSDEPLEFKPTDGVPPAWVTVPRSVAFYRPTA